MGSCASIRVHSRESTNIPRSEMVPIYYPHPNDYATEHYNSNRDFDRWWTENEMDLLVTAVKKGDDKTIKMYHRF